MTTMATAQSFDPMERRQYIGASEIAAVMGLDRWRTPLDVFRDKLGLATPFEGNNHTERGNRLEHIACELFTEISGKKLQRRTQAYTHPAHPYIAGHIDRIVVGERRIAEVKCPAVASFRKYQREGLPESMVVQLQVYMGLTGYHLATWLIFCADQFELATFDIEFDERIYNAAILAAVNFWERCVLTETPPNDGDTDGQKIEVAKFGGTVTVRDDDAFTAKAQALREAVELKRDAEELLECAKRDVIDAVEDIPGVYEGGGIRVYYTEQAGRVSLDKKAVAADGIDLSKYEKQGKPFKVFRPYLIS